jgi:hypothetical protein
MNPMPKFSRWMPPSPERRTTPAGWAALGVIAAGVGAAVVTSPFARGMVAVVAVCLGLSAVAERRSPQPPRALRAGEDIGTFVRALDRRDPAFDPWVVRAVWDALRAELRAGGVEMPLRPGDRLVADLGIDDEDLIFDVLPAVAARTSRSASWGELRAHPLARQVDTVADLIRLVALQPRRAAA